MQGIWLPNVTYLGTHTPPPQVTVQGSSPEKLSLSVEKPDHLEESSRVGVPDGWNSFWKRQVLGKGRGFCFNHPSPLPLLFQGLFSLRGRTIPSWRPCLPQYTPSFCPQHLEPSGPDEERHRGAKGVRSYLSYQGPASCRGRTLFWRGAGRKPRAGLPDGGPG